MPLCHSIISTSDAKFSNIVKEYGNRATATATAAEAKAKANV